MHAAIVKKYAVLVRVSLPPASTSVPYTPPAGRCGPSRRAPWRPPKARGRPASQLAGSHGPREGAACAQAERSRGDRGRRSRRGRRACRILCGWRACGRSLHKIMNSSSIIRGDCAIIFVICSCFLHTSSRRWIKSIGNRHMVSTTFFPMIKTW